MFEVKMKRILLIIQFLGTNYSGWQSQPNAHTVQDELQQAIFLALGERVEVQGSSRTDAGVHALAMPVHFDTNTRIQPNNIFKAINAYLPDDIKVISSGLVADDFNARFDVKYKTYDYNFYFSYHRLPYIDMTSTRVSGDFGYDLAKSACRVFKGKHDFASFCSANNQTKTTVRTIKKIDLTRTEFGYRLSITGDGFLYNMVRIIAGTIIDVGQHRLAVADLPRILEAKQRSLAGKTAEARGLVLREVVY